MAVVPLSDFGCIEFEVLIDWKIVVCLCCVFVSCMCASCYSP